MFRRKMKEGCAKNLALAICFMSVAAFAAPKSASAYYSDAAFQYIENRLPTAEITCNEGLNYYPNDQKLQMLLDRIHEAKDEQKNENKKNDPENNDQNQNQDQNNDQNQDQNKDQSDENKDEQNKDNQDNQGGESSSSQDDQQNGDENQDQDQGTESSSSEGGDEQQMPPQVPEGQMSPEEASQLLKDFDEQNGERKPWKPIRGQARPAKDW
ncbi:MAG: hypothetical protein HUK20_05655 [Fibrobacter sp.]|nr:hypothetical protein [Fibrobacter sp.]